MKVGDQVRPDSQPRTSSWWNLLSYTGMLTVRSFVGHCVS